ncbi:membrane-anchored ubiquitin-fold protein 1-like isoform X1 [Mangifera indica]|uniref:membrane-anchored ubiquitin-fold protein 1-like isoform X1 n=1 Tax=Mangifera indica TaxID=29780 RepID=UPI001CFBF402|nr:membrane-anchored ubiquitin-fold protein 1-like isoform X1 [Mangifera indica]XP_044506052.1 membrane-anchored ubiquitin-fold protein 1-like isoform X1 [Mangifera indica]XP_044506053.1 membrane-anchored ubiquitin-fold protein 1-like isoform X1 [Mangifera indica]XP_044506054.1 membrane-anchored ubiquitin-fold protein 1-like isoform X1 [Mangifera indica]XP_044506055.1 membrane-anchored ubiquitin-fold protein 1-like isoform X1 [Mangifera indica]
MAGVQDQLEIKFRLTDGSDIGPKSFPTATSVATLKESILAQWPKEKENGPRTVKDVKIISAGKILENNRTLGECQSPLCDIPGSVTTMHVIVQPPSQEKVCRFDTEKIAENCVLKMMRFQLLPSFLSLLWKHQCNIIMETAVTKN